MSFLDSSFLWFDAVVASCAAAMVCAVTGLYAIFKRVVFMPAALSQISGFGVVAAFFLGTIIPSLEGTFFTNPWVAALGVSIAAALVLGYIPEPKRMSREEIIGIAYIAASALVVIFSDLTPQEAHHVGDILFGNAVVVESSQRNVALGTAIGVILLHSFFFRAFLFASFDKDTAKAHGLPVRFLDALIFSSMGLAIAISTKTIGALPVFAYAVLPPAATLQLFQNTRTIFVVAPLLGALTAFLGYYISFRFELPTGACTTALSAMLLGCAVVVKLLSRYARRSI